ncbi:MAG: hypothetical protein WC455_11730 [Dehalococcoidia bacterium]|jgi:hypothetical protein
MKITTRKDYDYDKRGKHANGNYAATIWEKDLGKDIERIGDTPIDALTQLYIAAQERRQYYDNAMNAILKKRWRLCTAAARAKNHAISSVGERDR